MENATVTVRYRDREETFQLDGLELSCVGENRYLSTASRDYVAGGVERILIQLDAEERAR